MNSIRMHRRGGPESLLYEHAPVPRLLPGDVLVKVHTAAITPTELTWDTTYQTCEGDERIPSIPCHDVSGHIEALASGVTGLQVGDCVYGLIAFCRDGAAAEYVAVRAADLAPKPHSLDHVHAAAVPLSALTAWQALVVHAQLKAGQRILIHGAAGGVGTYAVQLARILSAHIIATASARNHAFLRELGANECLDYTTMRFEDVIRQVDVVLDTVGGETLSRSWPVLRRGGALVTIAGSVSPQMEEKFGVRAVAFIVEPDRDQLIQIAGLIDAGHLKPVISEIYPLPRADEAFTRGLNGHTRGKIVLALCE